MTIPPELATEAPVLAMFILFIMAAAGGGFGFIRYLLTWQEKREEKWQAFMAAQNSARDGQNEKRDEILNRVVQSLDAMIGKYAVMEKKVDIHHALVERMAENGGIKKSRPLQ
jgi:hypothetical protein